MGQVWVGHDQLLDREVAVKVLDLSAGTDPAAGERFRREAQAAAALSHPSVVAVHDAGIDDGSAYLVMELLPGPSLDQVIRDRGPLPVDEALDLARQAAAGLAAVHAAGIVHRDVKPGNLMLDSAGRVKVVDFGIARLAEMTATQVTAAGSVVGSPSYLAPEQARGDAATPASDHYALGCTLMVMLTGRPPFEAEQPVAVLRQHLDDAPPRVSERRADVPAGVDALVDDLLAKGPARRSHGIAALMGRAAGPAETAVLPAAGPPVNPGPGRRTTPWLAAAVVLGVLALAAVLVALAVGDDPDPVPAADPTSQAPRVQEEQPRPQPQPEEAEEQRQCDEDGNERQVFFRHADRAGACHEDEHAADQQPQRAMSEPAQRRAQQCVDRAGLAQHGERAADDEDEEDDLGRRLESPRHGGEDGDGRERRVVGRGLVAPGHDLHAAVLVLDALVLAGRQHPGQQEGQHDHAEQQHERMRDAGPSRL